VQPLKHASSIWPAIEAQSEANSHSENGNLRSVATERGWEGRGEEILEKAKCRRIGEKEEQHGRKEWRLQVLQRRQCEEKKKGLRGAKANNN
jgi:hypothetical protein